MCKFYLSHPIPTSIYTLNWEGRRLEFQYIGQICIFDKWIEAFLHVPNVWKFANLQTGRSLLSKADSVVEKWKTSFQGFCSEKEIMLIKNKSQVCLAIMNMKTSGLGQRSFIKRCQKPFFGVNCLVLELQGISWLLQSRLVKIKRRNEPLQNQNHPALSILFDLWRHFLASDLCIQCRCGANTPMTRPNILCRIWQASHPSLEASFAVSQTEFLVFEISNRPPSSLLDLKICSQLTMKASLNLIISLSKHCYVRLSVWITSSNSIQYVPIFFEVQMEKPKNVCTQSGFTFWLQFTIISLICKSMLEYVLLVKQLNSWSWEVFFFLWSAPMFIFPIFDRTLCLCQLS